jgi:hypothetical protein
MKKPPKYEIEKFHTERLGDYWQIWVSSEWVPFFNEDTAKLTCDALNAHDGIRKLRRKARELEAAVSFFNASEE